MAPRPFTRSSGRVLIFLDPSSSRDDFVLVTVNDDEPVQLRITAGHTHTFQHKEKEYQVWANGNGPFQNDASTGVIWVELKTNAPPEVAITFTGPPFNL